MVLFLYHVVPRECTFNSDCICDPTDVLNQPICEHDEEFGFITNGGICTCATADSEFIEQLAILSIFFDCMYKKLWSYYEWTPVLT